MNIYRWIENIWNLRLIFDKYLPKIREILETIKRLQEQLEDLRQAKIDMEKEIKKIKGELKEIPSSKDELPMITKSSKYYDPQMGVEYYEVEINGEKASSEDDTVAEE